MSWGRVSESSPSWASVAAQPLYGPWSRVPSPPGPRRVPGVFLKSGRGTVLLCRGKGVCAVIVHRRHTAPFPPAIHLPGYTLQMSGVLVPQPGLPPVSSFLFYLICGLEQNPQTCNMLPPKSEEAYKMLCFFLHGGRCTMRSSVLSFGWDILFLHASRHWTLKSFTEAAGPESS